MGSSFIKGVALVTAGVVGGLVIADIVTHGEVRTVIGEYLANAGESTSDAAVNVVEAATEAL